MTGSIVAVLMAQVVALRAQVEALASAVEELRQQWPLPTEAPGCPHSDVENIGTFGAPEYRCRACQQSVEMPS